MMALKELMTDKLTLVKQDGSVFRENIPALVTPGQITTFVADLPVEVGDHFLRQLPSGLVEDFIVDRPEFSGGLPSTGAVLLIKVRRSDQPAAVPQTVINHVTGQNARVNISSTDNSSNLAMGDSSQLFTQLRSAISEGIASEADRNSLLALVDELQIAAANNDGSFKERYAQFLMTAAPSMTIISPFIPALTGLI